jgi:hypothetical protein
MSAVRAILINPRYLGYQVSGRTKKKDVLLDPDVPALGHVTRQQWQQRDEWVTSTVQAYDAIVEEQTWHRVQALVAGNTRTKAATPSRRTHAGVRRSDSSRYPLAGLVICDACGKKLQGNTVRGYSLYRCYVSSDYASPFKDHPPSLSVREDRLLVHIDQWLSKLFNPENIEATATAIVTADSEARREDPEVARARITLLESERKLAKHLDGLEAGISADVIAPRIAAAQREKAAAEAVIASAPPTPQPLALDEVIETLSMLRDLPELLGAIEQADRAALYQALGLHVTYRRVGAVERVRLRTSLRAVELERVGVGGTNTNSLVPALRSVELERVGGGTFPPATRETILNVAS